MRKQPRGLMRKRLVALLVCLALLPLAGAGPAARGEASSGASLTFLSVNDLVPPELINAIVWYGGREYVPWQVFANYGLGVHYSFFQSSQTAYLYTDDRQLFFDLKNTSTFDGYGYYYSAHAIYLGGAVYLPLRLTCSFFDLRVSTISGSDYGVIARIVTEPVLTDEELHHAATSHMRRYYERYQGETPEPTAPPAETEKPVTHEGATLSLSFTGLPAGELLDRMKREGLRTAFFVTAEQVRSDPALLRRIAGEGHWLGVLCLEDPETEWPETAALIFAAARDLTLLLAAGEDVAESAAAYAAENGLVWCAADRFYGETGAGWLAAAWLEETEETDPALRLDAAALDAAALSRLLDRVRDQKYNIKCPRETDRAA